MIDKHDLIGRWHLRSWVLSEEGVEGVSHPFGERPQGLLVYTEDGWMTASISRSSRDSLPTDTAFRRIESALLSRAFLSYFHYAGRYRVQNDTVIHSVTQSLNPNFPGTEQVRTVNLSGDQMVLSGVEQAGDIKRVHSLTWQRTSLAD